MKRLALTLSAVAVGALALVAVPYGAAAAPRLPAKTDLVKDDGLVEQARRGVHFGFHGYRSSGYRHHGFRFHSFGYRSYPSFSYHSYRSYHPYRYRSIGLPLYFGSPYASYYRYSSPSCWWSHRWHKWVCNRSYW